MPDYSWPEASKRSLIGKRISRLDGAEKVSGRAKYTYDLKRPGMLWGKIVRSPHAHAKIVSVDTSAAEKMPGVKAVKVIQGPGTEIQWAGDEIAVVAATEEHLAEDAARAIVVKYDVLPHFVREEDLAKAGERIKPAAERVTPDFDKAMASAEVTVEGTYSIPVITHCCLESHGQISEWEGEDKVNLFPSTQAVSTIAGALAQPLGIPVTNIHVHMDHVGGGFGSKFNIDRWGVEGTRLSKLAGGKAVKIMLERDAELMVAGARPSTFAKVKVGAKKDGTIVAWESTSWGTGGPQPPGAPPLPYIWTIPNSRVNHTGVATNIGPQRAWRAPNHPQACFVTMSALEDLAAALKMDPLEMCLKNIELLPRSALYKEELLKGAELIEWKKKWHPRGDPTPGSIKRGVGLALHTWGGTPHNSECRVTINPDGSVSAELGSQDLGTGTRTAIAIVVADTLGLPLDGVKVVLGDNRLPPSNPSGGSTTIGGVSSSSRRAAVDALDALLRAVAGGLNADPNNLEAVGGKIQVKGDPSKSIAWKQACSKLGVNPVTATGKQPDPNKGTNLASGGVSGVQMAEVSVDVETGIVKVEKLVAVQDMGLIIAPKTAESQIYGALIMGVCWALYEEKVMDQISGKMLNPNMEFYKLAGIKDIGNLVVHMVSNPEQDKRGVIGLGEPPAVSPGAAIANAVANAIGVRVPSLPLTPERVLGALEKKGGLT
jgi:xanthine dehydrogenase YagR molybdenum-binding subunit